MGGNAHSNLQSKRRSLRSTKKGTTKTAALQFDETERCSMKCVFDNLALRGHGKGMCVDVFLSFFMANSLVGERLFNIFNVSHTGHLNYEEFAHGLELLYKGTLAERAQLVFDLYDLTSNGKITKVEMKMMLHYMPSRALHFACMLVNKSRRSSSVMAKLAALDDGHLHGEKLSMVAEKTVLELQKSIREDDEMEIQAERRRSTELKANDLSALRRPKRLRARNNLGPMDHCRLQRTTSLLRRQKKELEIEHILKICFPNGGKSIDRASFKQLVLQNPVLVPALSAVLIHPAEIARETLCHSRLKKAEAESTDSFVCSLIALDLALMTGSTSPEMKARNSGFASFDVPKLPMPEKAVRRKDSFIELDSKMASDLEGKVLKLSKGGWHKRWCTLKGRVLWQYKTDHAKQPYKALFLEGCVVEPSCNRERGLIHRKQLYGIHIEVVNDEEDEACIQHPSWEFFFDTQAKQQTWLTTLCAAAHTVPFSEAYDKLRLLGTGRAGKVYMCRPRTGNRDNVAVKVIEKQALGKIEQRMLRTEARILRFISHPNCVRLFDVVEERKSVYLIMEMLPMDFFDAISGKPRFTEMKWYRVIVPLVNALVYLHDLGIVHRDMKPENILCNEDLTIVKLTDFGLARILLPREFLRLDAGTAAYKAPEVLTNRGYGAEADIWGIGVIMYLVLAGKWPFIGPTQVEQIIRHQPSFKGKCWRKASSECRTLVRQLLTKDPRRRPHAEELLEHPWMKMMAARQEQEVLSRLQENAISQLAGAGAGDDDAAPPPPPAPAMEGSGSDVVVAKRLSSVSLATAAAFGADADQAMTYAADEDMAADPLGSPTSSSSKVAQISVEKEDTIVALRETTNRVSDLPLLRASPEIRPLLYLPRSRSRSHSGSSTSPRSVSPHGSPRTSPRSSPRTSPRSSPHSSPLMGRRAPWPQSIPALELRTPVSSPSAGVAAATATDHNVVVVREVTSTVRDETSTNTTATPP